MHHHVIAHAGSHILRTIIHIAFGIAVVSGIGWGIHQLQTNHDISALMQSLVHSHENAKKEAEHLLEHH